jgi:hypothetical protein
MGIAETKAAIDSYLAAPGVVPDYEDILDPYMDNVMGFKEIEENLDKVKEANPEVSKEDIDTIVKEEKDKMKAQLKDKLKPELENKLNDLRAQFAKIKDETTTVGKEIIKGTADAVAPKVIGPVGPNPMHTALQIISISISAIRAINACLRAASKAFGLIQELGLEKTDLAEKLAGLMTPLMALKQEAAANEASNEEASVTCPDPKQAFTYEVDGTDRDGLEIEEWAKNHGILIPLDTTGEGKLDDYDENSAYSAVVKEWSKAVRKFADWFESI